MVTACKVDREKAKGQFILVENELENLVTASKLDGKK